MPDITADIERVAAKKLELESKALRDVSDQMIKSPERPGPVYEILDILFAATGYNRAPVPGGEAYACAQFIGSVVHYMVVRSIELNGQTPYDLEQDLEDMVRRCARLQSECIANRTMGG